MKKLALALMAVLSMSALALADQHEGANTAGHEGETHGKMEKKGHDKKAAKKKKAKTTTTTTESTTTTTPADAGAAPAEH